MIETKFGGKFEGKLEGKFHRGKSKGTKSGEGDRAARNPGPTRYENTRSSFTNVRTRHARGNIKAFSLRLPIARNFERQIVETNDSVFLVASEQTEKDNVGRPRSVRRNASDNAYARLANRNRLSLSIRLNDRFD